MGPLFFNLFPKIREALLSPAKSGHETSDERTLDESAPMALLCHGIIYRALRVAISPNNQYTCHLFGVVRLLTGGNLSGSKVGFASFERHYDAPTNCHITIRRIE